jgi:hypothetical protein
VDNVPKPEKSAEANANLSAASKVLSKRGMEEYRYAREGRKIRIKVIKTLRRLDMRFQKSHEEKHYDFMDILA